MIVVANVTRHFISDEEKWRESDRQYVEKTGENDCIHLVTWNLYDIILCISQ
jgi:hypothetical protein